MLLGHYQTKMGSQICPLTVILPLVLTCQYGNAHPRMKIHLILRSTKAVKAYKCKYMYSLHLAFNVPLWLYNCTCSHLKLSENPFQFSPSLEKSMARYRFIMHICVYHFKTNIRDCCNWSSINTLCQEGSCMMTIVIKLLQGFFTRNVNVVFQRM